MKEETGAMMLQPHEQHRRIELVNRLSRIRIYYTFFCLALVFAVREYLQVSPRLLIPFAAIAFVYSFYRYYKPSQINGKCSRSLPILINLPDLFLIAVLVYITGGVKSLFLVAYVIPIGGNILTFGSKAGWFNYGIAMGLTGATYFLNRHTLSFPTPYYFIVAAVTIALAVRILGLQAEKEWRLRDTIYQASITDHLSGLYNSRFLRTRIGEEITRCSQDGTGFVLSFIDLNNFKAINDQYGHLIGDQVLRQCAQLLAGNIRKSDILSRYGGDEFVLFMPGAGTAQAEIVMQRIKQAVAASTCFQDIAIGLSYGLASFPEDGNSLEQLLTAADARMYAIKGA